MERAGIVVIGTGIAGASARYALSENVKVILLAREPAGLSLQIQSSWRPGQDGKL